MALFALWIAVERILVAEGVLASVLVEYVIMYMICRLFLNEKTNLWIRYDFSVIKLIGRSFQMTQILVITFRNVK